MTDRISPAEIVASALGLLAEGGLHALAMRRIATEVGVQQSALYWHFDNKQRLLAAVADELVAPIEVPAGGAWTERVEVLAARLRGELLRYPDGAELVATTFAFRLGARQPHRQFTDELTNAGLAPSSADVAAAVLLHFVLGYVTDEQQHLQAAALGAIESAASERDARSADERFIEGIRLIVAGIAARSSIAAGPNE